jgi:ADP-heptose:LPS heptosyltransferase
LGDAPGASAQTRDEKMIFDYLGQTLLHSLGIKPAKQCFNSILVIRNDHIGDVILSLPVLRALRNLGHFRISYLCTQTTAPLLKHSHDIDDLIIHEVNETRPVLASRLNDLRPDVILNFNSIPYNARLVSGIEARIKVAYAYKAFNIIPFNKFVFIHRRRDLVHELDFMLGFLKALGYDHPKYVTKGLLTVPVSAGKEADTWLKKNRVKKNTRILGVHPGSRHSADNWSAENYIRFISQISKKKMKNLEVVVLLGPAEIQYIPDFKNELAHCRNVHMMENDLSLEAWASLIDRMNLLVSSSTGPMHMAGALETPTLSLFSSRRAQVKEKWHPLNTRWHVIEARPHQTINESIMVEDVVERAGALLKDNLTK